MSETNAQVSTRTAESIAFEINTIKNHAKQVILHSSVEIGRRLEEVKSLVPHGQWGAWLQENVDYSQSTANNLMAIAKEYGSNPQAFGNLSYTKAVALLSVPSEAREQLAQEHDLENMSSRDMQKLVKQNKDLAMEAARAEAEAAKQRERAEKIQAEVKKLKQEHQVKVDALNTAIEEAKKAGDPEKAKRLEAEVTQAKQEIQQLTEQLNNQPIETPAVVEKVPDEVQQELEKLRSQNRVLQSQDGAKFNFVFEQVVKDWQSLSLILENTKKSDPEIYTKLHKIAEGLLAKMGESI